MTSGSDFLKVDSPQEGSTLAVMSGHMQAPGILINVDAERILFYRDEKGLYETNGKSPFSRQLSQSRISVT